MAKFVSALVLALLLTSLSEWKISLGAAPTVAACGYTNKEQVLQISCTPHPGNLPIRVMTERGLTVSFLGTSVTLNNATQLTLEPPQQSHEMKLDFEIKNCGLSGLLLLAEVAESPHLVLNLSGLSLRLGDHDQFASCGRVAALNLSRNRIDEVPTNAFNGMSGLLGLDLSQNQISYLDNITFCELTSLRWLDLRDNPMVMTFALTKLPALESLDASMSVLEVGVFCRMSNLRRLALHQTVDQLQCFVFDNLPKLRDLSFSYFAGSSSICFTMMCDPHPVLGGRVPFNFRINQLNSDGKTVKVSNNNFITKLKYSLYVKLCKTNYDTYLIHHDNNMPLTTGCLKHENDSVVCPFSAPPLTCPLPILPMSTIPTVEAEVFTSSILTSQPTETLAPVSIFNAAETEASEIFRSALADSTTIPVAYANTTAESLNWNVTAEVTGDTVTNPPAGKPSPRRLTELEAEIVHLERVIVVVYSINGALLFGMLVLLGCCLRARYLHCQDRRRRGRWPDTEDGWLRQQQQTQLLATNGVTARQVPQQHQQESYGYLPMHDPVGRPKLTEAIANPNYGQPVNET